MSVADSRLAGSRGAAALLIIAALALGLRTAAPLADPPRWLTVSYAALVDGPWYVAEAEARADPSRSGGDSDSRPPSSYRKPLYTRFCQVVYADRKSTRLNSSHIQKSRMPSSA